MVLLITRHLFRYGHLIVILLCFLLVHFILFQVYGIRNLLDADRYIDAADFLIAQGRLEDNSYFFYAVPITLMAICRWIFPGEIVPFIILQVVLSGVALLFLYKTATQVFKSSVAGVLSVLIILFWWDHVHWNTVTMTESIFVSIICFILYRLVVFRGVLSDWVTLLFLTGLIVFTRPTGVLIAVATVFFLIHYYWSMLSTKPVLKFGIFLALMGIIVTGLYLMFSLWDFTEQYNKGNIVTYADVAEQNELGYDGLRIDVHRVTPEYSQAHPVLKMVRFAAANPIHFLKAAVMKIGYLITAVRPYYSWKHNVFSVLWLSVVYTLFAIGLSRLTNFPLKYFVLTIIAVNCLLVGISSVDWDNRFYVPMVPGIALFAGGGAGHAWDWLKRNRRHFGM